MATISVPPTGLKDYPKASESIKFRSSPPSGAFSLPFWEAQHTPFAPRIKSFLAEVGLL